MTDPNPPTAALHIPADTQAKFGDLIALIQGSESMNNEERQYWINILPIMTQEQLKNLQDILQNEKRQLSAIDAKYSKEAAAIGDSAAISSMEQKIKDRKHAREMSEQADAEIEQQEEAELMAKIQSM